MGSLSLSGWPSPLNSETTPLLSNVAHIPYPNPNDLETPESLSKKHFRRFAPSLADVQLT